MARIALSKIPTVASLIASGMVRTLANSELAEQAAAVAHRVGLLQGDITTLEVDAIVNAANKTLRGGGGVDGAIHSAAGKDLLAECSTLGGCETGDAKVTKGYNLPTKYVIHTVGPIYSRTHAAKHSDALKNAYRRSLEEAVKLSDVRSVAFPGISTGVYAFPIEEATHIALKTVAEFLVSSEGEQLELVVFCSFGESNLKLYQELAPLYFTSAET